MFFFIIQNVIISLILIVIIHNLYSFFKTTLTTPKIKDLVNGPANTYKDIHDIIQNQSQNNLINNKENLNSSSNLNSDNNELVEYLNTLKTDSNQIQDYSDISSLTNNFSSYS